MFNQFSVENFSVECGLTPTDRAALQRQLDESNARSERVKLLQEVLRVTFPQWVGLMVPSFGLRRFVDTLVAVKYETKKADLLGPMVDYLNNNPEEKAKVVAYSKEHSNVLAPVFGAEF